ncbi:unnamed protein product [Lathyrus sativus]|nr:unnamed protein product [Lathyrus sativus]
MRSSFQHIEFVIFKNKIKNEALRSRNQHTTTLFQGGKGKKTTSNQATFFRLRTRSFLSLDLDFTFTCWLASIPIRTHFAAGRSVYGSR